jgi:hypothetical protein
LRNDQGLIANGTITIAPQTGSTIDGSASIAFLPAQECTVICDGTNWHSFGLARRVVISTYTLTSPAASALILLPSGYKEFELHFWNLLTNAASGNSDDWTFSLSQDGGITWPAKMNAGVVFQGGTSGSANQAQNTGLTAVWLSGQSTGSPVSAAYPAITQMRLVQGVTGASRTMWQFHGGAWPTFYAWVSHYLSLGYFDNDGPVNALKFMPATSTQIMAGSVRVTGEI